MKTVRAGVLDIAYLDHGPENGPPVVLLHGFPYDVRAYDAAVTQLAEAGLRCLVPWLRGYGPTRFADVGTMRAGQQGALAADLQAFMDALGIERAILGGYDWGGRAACIVAALWPDRCAGLVSAGVGYNIQNIPGAANPLPAAQEARYWYQHLFNTPRGPSVLSQARRDIARQCWTMWSPDWAFDTATFEASAPAFDNPDFVDVVIHSYRHRYSGVPGDPAYDAIEDALERQPAISVPAVVLLGASDAVTPPGPEDTTRAKFTGPYERQILPYVGNNVPQEAPKAFAKAVLSLN